MNDDDLRLLASARAGHQEAFAQLYDRHAAVVLSLCRRSVASLADAEDATQETFIRAFRRLDTLQDPTRFRPWLYRIARHVCSERRRSRSRRARHEEIAMSQTVTRVEPNNRETREDFDRLNEAIDRLDERERLVIHLHYLEADPVRTAKEALGISRSAYYKLLNRARQQLAVLLREVPQS